MSVNVQINYDGRTLDTLTGSSKITYATANKYLEENLEIDFTGTDDATATAGDILAGKTAYISDGSKATGTIETKTADDVTVSGASVTTPAGYYASAVTKTVASGTQGTPTATKGTVTDHSVSITPSATDTTGYITGTTKTGTAVTVTASELVSGTASITTTGEVDVTNYAKAQVSDADLVASNVRDGVNILGVAGTFTDAATVSSGQSAAAAANILTTKSAWVDGAEVKGSMPNNGAVTNTITAQGGTYTIPAGYHNGSGVVTASITATVLDNTIISGEAFEETTGDYGWKSTVEIPAGYHNAQTLEKTFSEVFPAPETPGTSADVLLGKQFYDKDGKVVTGTMANNGAVSSTISAQGGTYTVPAGYHNGSGKITASINDGVITSGAGSATVSDPTYNSTSGKFDQTVSGTVAAPTVGTAGYVSSTAGTKNTNTVSGSKELTKIVGSTTVTGTKTYAPTLARTAKPTGDTWTDAASGAATTTKPTAGAYVQIDAAANTGTITATPSVTTAGYGTATQHGIAAGTATVGAAKATTAYVPITAGSATTPATTKLQSAPSITVSNTGLVTASVAATSVDVTPTVSEGWVSSGTVGTVTMSANSATKQLDVKAAATYTASTSDQTIAAGQYLTGAQTIKAVTLNATASNMLAGTTATITSNGTTVATVTGSIATWNGEVVK